MTIYFGLVLGVIFLYIASLALDAIGAQKVCVDRVHNIVIGISIFLLFALRSPSVGVDVNNYLARFELGNALETRKMTLEIGYATLNDGVRWITSDPHVFLTIVAAVTITPVAWTIGKSSKNVYLSWILFISIGPFAFMLSGLRQGIALAIVFATLPLLARRAIFTPVILIGIASTFHTSALVFLPAIALSRMRLNIKTAFATASTLVVLAFFGEKLVAFAIESVYDTYELVETGAYRWSLANAALWLSFTPFHRRIANHMPKYEGLYLIVLAGVLLLSLTAFGTNVGRSAIYYLQFFAILAPNALSMVTDRRLGTLLSAVLGVAVLAYFFITVGGTAYEIVPYQFKWEG